MTLERIEHKVFASEAPLEEMGQFGSALATTKLNTKDVAEIQALPAYTKGWGSAIISENNYPAMEEMNGVLNVMSYHTGYLYQEGIPTYSATQEYSATSWVKDLAGEKVYKSLQSGNKGHNLTDPAWWKELSFGGGMPIGTIFSHTCSASFIPENSLPCDGSEYTQGQLPNVYNDWLVDGKLKTCTYTEYSNMLATYGQCPMWGLDTTNKKFKVPTIKDGAVIQQAMSGSEIGKAYNAGLPNIEGSMKVFGDQGVGSNVETTPSGALYSGDLIGTGVPMRATNHQGYRLSFDASRSNSIYGGSNTVQSNAVALRYFVVVATKSINASVMDWSNLANSLTSKLNTDVSNITAQGRSSIAGFAAPSNRYTDFTIGAAWSTYTAPANGYIMVDYSVTSQGGWSFIWNTTSKLGVGGLGSYWTGIQNRWTLPVKKGDVIEISYDGVTMRTIRFVYAQGEA